MKLQKLLSYVRKAVEDYEMIKDGDRICIGLSGGKDSLSLLTALAGMRRFYPASYHLEAVCVSLGFDMDFEGIKQYCDSLNVNFTLVNTDIGSIIFDERKESNPCSLCSKMRKGALNEAADKLNCNKVALGHNRDDVIETFFMSLFYEGRIYTFSPVSYLDRMKLYSIRPLIYVPESGIVSFAEKYGIKPIVNKCPADGNTKRTDMKAFIKERSKEDDNFESKMFGAIKRSEIRGWRCD